MTPRRARAVTAAAVRISPVKAGGMRKLVQPWQQRALGYYDLVGEAWFASQFYARALSQIRFFPATRDDDGEVEETEDPAINELFGRIQDPGGGTSQIKSSYGRLMFLTGEGYLLVTNPDGDEEMWEFVSGDELRVTPDGNYARFTAPGSASTELENVGDESYEVLAQGQAIAYRMWRRAPRYSALADAPMRAVLDLFEELLLLQMAVRARVKSRLAASGILVLSDEITFGSADVGEPSEDPRSDPFLAALIEHMVAPIQDEGTAAAVVPHLVRIPTNGRPIGDLIQHIKLHDPTETYQESGLRIEAIKRIAIGLDLPPEILLGMADSNHWTAWQIDEQVAKAHIFPVAQQFCDDLTSAYLRPAAREQGIGNWSDLVVSYDAADLVVHPDRGENAKEAFDRKAIGFTSLRESLGFDDDDAPTDEDLELMTGPAVEPEDDEAGEEDQTGNDTEEQPPQLRAVATTIDSDELARKKKGRYRALGVAEAHVDRARDVAGARLRGRVQRQEGQALVQGLPNAIVAHTLSQSAVESLGVTAVELVGGTAEAFVRSMVRQGMSLTHAEKLGDIVQAHAARTLYEPDAPELPKAFESYLARLDSE